MKNNNKKEKTDMQFGPVRYAAYLRAFLGADPCMTVECNDEEKCINVVVSGCPYKAECLETILITADELDNNKEFNLNDYDILVNGKRSSFRKVISHKIIEAALAGNPFYKDIKEYKMPKEYGGLKRWFGMLSPEVCQTPCDNFGSPYGIETFTPEWFIRYALTRKARKSVAWTTDRK